MKTNGRPQLFPLFRITMLFASGVWAGRAFAHHTGVWPWIAAAALALACAVMLYRRALWQTVMIFAASFLAGGSVVTARLAAQERSFAAGRSHYHAVITGTPVVRGKVVRCDLVATGAGRPFKLKASILRDSRTPSLRTGDGLAVSSVIERPHNYRPTGFDYARYLTDHGYSGQTFIYKTCWHRTAPDMRSLPLMTRVRLKALRLREHLLARYRQLGMTGDIYAVVSAMTLGAKEGMPEELRETYSVTGASHVLALSGLHLGIIYAVLSSLLVWRRARPAGMAAVLAAIWAYVFVTGLPLSAVRSAVMITVYAAATVYNRDRMSLNALAAAALAMLAVAPCSLFDAGFQMSFMAVFFILVFYRPIYNMVPERLRRHALAARLWQMTAVSVAAQAGVAPLIMFYFGRFSCYSLLAGFFVIPAAALILYGAAALLLLAFVPAVQQFLAAALSLVTGLLNAGVAYMSALPGADISGIVLRPVQVWLIYGIIFALYGLLRFVRKVCLFGRSDGLPPRC